MTSVVSGQVRDGKGRGLWHGLRFMIAIALPPGRCSRFLTHQADEKSRAAATTSVRERMKYAKDPDLEKSAAERAHVPG